MSIKSELNNTKNNLRSVRKSILARGGEIAINAGLKDLPEAIYKIPADASLAFQTDDSVAYEKIVPSGTEEYAQVAKVGGMTYKSNNLCKIMYVNDSEVNILDYSSASVKFLQNQYSNYEIYIDDTLLLDRLITYSVKGLPDTCISNIVIYVYDENGEKINDYGAAPGDTFIVNSSEGASFAATLAVYAAVPFEQDTEITFQFMINEDGTALPYEPYFEGLRDTKVTELESEGANLFPIDYPQAKRGTVYNGAGLTFAVDNDGVITVNGTYNGNEDYHPFRLSLPFPDFAENWLNKKITVSGCPKGGGDTTYYISNVHTGTKETGNGLTVNLLKDLYCIFDIRIMKGFTANNLIFKPMLNRGETVLPFSPAGKIVDTFPISAELRAFLEQYGYGRGVEGYPNYIDFERKVFVQNTCRVVLDGISANRKVTTMGIAQGYNFASLQYLPYSAVQENDLYTQGVCTHFKVKFKAAAGYCYIAGVNHTQLLMYNTDQTLTTVDAWNEWLKEQYDSGNPVTIEYAMAEPIEIDISAYLTDDNFIAVEGGGTIKTVNEHEQDAPSTINYIEKVG